MCNNKERNWSRTHTVSADAKYSVEKLEKIVLEEPPMPNKDQEEKMTNLILHQWQKKLDVFLKRKEQLESNLKSACSLVLGQCAHDK